MARRPRLGCMRRRKELLGVDAVVAKRGYVQGRNWLTRSFPGQKHNEDSWASRVDIPLKFLLPATK